MRHHPRAKLFVLAICLALAFARAHGQAPGPQAPDPQPSATTSISGRVVDGLTQTPVSGAVVTIGGALAYAAFDDIASIDALDRQLSKRRTQLRTDRDGRFAFTDLPPGSYGVTARMEGWSTGAYGAAQSGDPRRWLDAAAGQRAAATIAIWKHPWIGGTVLTDAGEPLQGVSVQVLQPQFAAGRRSLELIRQFETDDRGEYGGTVPPGEYIVRAQSSRTRVRAWTDLEVPMSGFPPVFYPAALSPDAAAPVTLTLGARMDNVTLRLPLQPMRRLAGQLTNSTGIPTRPTTVTLISQDGLDTRRGAPVDARGRFSFDRLFPGRYLLETSSSRSLTPGAVPMLWASAIVEIQDADGVVTLPLRRGLLVRGRLHFDGPDPPSAALLPQFSAFMLPPPAEMGHMVPPRVHVQTDGTFALELPGGEYLARLTNGDNIGILFDASTPRPSDAEIQALHAWRVRSAVANGRDIIDAPLLLSAEVTEVVVTLARGNTALYGRVRAGLNLPQDYRLVLIPADRALWAYSGNGRRFVAAPVSSDGRFSVPAPPGDYLIGAVRELPTNWRNGDVIAQLATAMSGVHLPDGGATLQLDPPAIEMRSVTHDATAAAITTDTTRDVLRPRAVPDLPLPAPAGVTVTGQVVSDEDGRPLADVRISQYPSGVPDVFTDSAGRFILRVEPGRRTIYAWKSAWSTFNAHGEGPSLMVTGDVDGLVVRMARAAEITGVVRDQEGAPVQASSVRAWNYQPGRDAVEGGQRSWAAWALTDEQGRYRLARLPPGRYVVATSASTGRYYPEIPETTQADVDRATGRSAPDRPTRESPPRGFPAVFNGGVIESLRADPIALAPGSRHTVDLDVAPVQLATVIVTLRSSTGLSPALPDARLEAVDRIISSAEDGVSRYLARMMPDELVFENVLPGRYAFGVRSPLPNGQHVSAFADIVVSEGEQQRLTIDLLPGSTVSGRVTVDGVSPAPGAGVVIRADGLSHRMNLRGPDASASVADDGTFSIANVLPGRYRFSLVEQQRSLRTVPLSQTVEGRETLHAGVEVRAGESVSDLRLELISRGFELTGTVRDSEGRPAQGATVLLFPADRAAWHPHSPHVVSTRTDGNGVFQLRNLPHGDYRVTAAYLDADVWLDPDLLGRLAEGSVALSIRNAPVDPLALVVH